MMGKTMLDPKWSLLAFAVVVAIVIAMGLLPAWNVHLVPDRWLRALDFRYGWSRYLTEYELWEVHARTVKNNKEEALALKARFKPGDSVVAGGIGVRGYYSGLHILDPHGLVNRHVAMAPKPKKLGTPGHDIGIKRDFFYSEVPTIINTHRIGGPPYPLSPRIRRVAEYWRRGRLWRRYVPEVLPLKPSEDGSPNVLLVLRLIEGEPPAVASLPRPERVAIRKELARKAWADFYARLDSWKDGGETEPPRVFRRVFYLSPASARPDLCRRSYQCSKSVGGISSIGPRPVPKLSPFEIDHKSAA